MRMLCSVELMAAAERMGLEGVVSKRRDAPNRSGTKCGWVKVKTQAWREANRERWRPFRVPIVRRSRPRPNWITPKRAR